VGKMKKEYKNYIIVFLLIFFLSFYITSVHQAYRNARYFNEWYECTLKNQYKQLSEQKTGENDNFFIEKINDQTVYINEVMISEMENMGRVGIFPVLTLRSLPVTRKKMIYNSQMIPCIGNAFMNYKSTFSEYQSIFEKEHDMSFEDWNEQTWRDFLEYLGKELPDFDDAQKYEMSEKELEKNLTVDTDIKALKRFYERTLERYKTNIENGETNKAIFDIEMLKSMNDIVTNGGDVFPFEIRSLKEEYVSLIKENVKFTFPLALWLWIVCIITYAMLRKENTSFPIGKRKIEFKMMKKQYKFLLIVFIIILLLSLILFSSLCAFLLINDKKLIIIQAKSLSNVEDIEISAKMNAWELTGEQIIMQKYPKMNNAIEEADIEKIKETFNEIDALERDFWKYKEEYLKLQVIKGLQGIKNEEFRYIFPWPSAVKKVDGLYLVVVPKENLTPTINKRESSENLEEKIRSKKEEILEFCKNGETEKAKDSWEETKNLRMIYWSAKQSWIEMKVIIDLSVITI
jgi:hypothetical protein